MKSIILFRKTLAEENEFEIAKKYFNVVELRSEVPKDHLVICRYSSLPYYRELERDLLNVNSKLINSHQEHQYIANFDYYHDLTHLTPKTWFSLAEVLADDFKGPVVLKGQTNSKKQLFKTHMFAKNQKEMMEVYGRLLDDTLISHQNIIVREFVELENYGTNEITGMPIAKEFRLFFYKNAGGFSKNHLIKCLFSIP